MVDLPYFHPDSLSESQLDRLSQCAGEAETIPVAELLLAARQHLERTHIAHTANRLINVRLAAAIVGVLEELAGCCNSLKVNEIWWVKWARHYFAGMRRSGRWRPRTGGCRASTKSAALGPGRWMNSVIL